MKRARMNPDGTVQFADRAYRLVELEGGKYQLRRVVDGVVIGGFTLPPAGSESTAPQVEIGSDGGEDAEVVRAVAELMGGPGGALPLQ